MKCILVVNKMKFTVFNPFRKNGPGQYKVCCGPTFQYLPKLNPLMNTIPFVQPLMSKNVSGAIEFVSFRRKFDWMSTGAIKVSPPSTFLQPVKLFN